MLHKSEAPNSPSHTAGPLESPFDQIDLRWMFSALLHYRKLIVLLPLMFVAFAVLFVLLRAPTFSAATQLELTNLRLAFSREDALFAETHPDPTFLETQLQVIRSDRVALSVLQNMKLIDTSASAHAKAEALEKLRRGFSVMRVGLSNVVSIEYRSSDPEMAAQLANEFARAYIAEQNSVRWDAAQAASGWLRDRLREVGPKARVVAEALPPRHKSNTRGLYIIAAAGMVGGALAVIGAFALKFFDRRIRTPEDAVAATGVECLGVVPRMPPTTGPLSDEALGPLPPNFFDAGKSRLSYALEYPHSETGATLQNVRAACDECFAGAGLRYLGVTSTFVGEGRSTISANLAMTLALGGKRVLLVDGDSDDAGLSKKLASVNRPGLADYLASEQDTLEAYVLTERRTGLHFLPNGNRSEAGGGIWSNNLRRFFEETLTTYECVIFDIPVLGKSGEIRDASRYLEGFLLVVDWGKVSPESIRVGMSSASRLRERLLGTVLNKADVRKVRWLLSPKIAFLNKSRRRSALSGGVGSISHHAEKERRPNKTLVKATVVFLVLAAALLP